MIVDHSIDILSILQKTQCNDLRTFLQCLKILPSAFEHGSHKEYSIKEDDEELLLKEWIKREGIQPTHRNGSFIESLCFYLEDVKIIIHNKNSFVRIEMCSIINSPIPFHMWSI